MTLTDTEKQMLSALKNCRYLPGSFDNKFSRDMPLNADISPLQKWWLHKLCHKYRKQINNDILATIALNYIETNPEPMSRKQAAGVLKSNQQNQYR